MHTEKTPLLNGHGIHKGSLDLPFKVKAGYSVGHVLNDLCAATWFTYLLVFLEAAGLTKVQAGLVMLCGQLSDGLMTPCVGILSDACSIRIQWIGFGRRKLWHLCGSFVVALCYSAVYAYLPYSVYIRGSSAMTIYYAIAASLFNIGWASVQVSHMALVPELHENPAVRTQLNAGRYAFTILSNASVFILYIIIWPIYSMRPDPFVLTFKMITLVVICIGVFATVMFHTLVREPSYHYRLSEDVPSGGFKVLRKGLRSFRWLKSAAFWLTGLNYMCTRLFINLSQVYIVFYVVETLKMSDTARATIPLTVYASSLFATFPQKNLFRYVGRRRSYLVGASFGIGACIGFLFMRQKSNLVYLVSVILGFANSTMMVVSVTLEADLIGNDLRSNAFVYGLMSFGDKVLNGVVVVLIQIGREKVPYEDEAVLMRYVMSGVIGLAAILASLAIVFLSSRAAEDGKSELKEYIASEVKNHK